MDKHIYVGSLGESLQWVRAIPAEHLPDLVALVNDFATDLPGPTSRQVVVLDIGPEYEELVRAGKAFTLEGGEDEVWGSASKLSQHMGMKSNDVARALALARHRPGQWFADRGMPYRSARVRGVLVRYLDDEVS